MVYSDDNYYLLAHYPKYEGITHFRVDKLTEVCVMDEKTQDIETVAGKGFKISEYVKKVFSMFHGTAETVRMLCDESVLNVVIDKFGEDVFLRKESDGRFVVTANAVVSPTFYSWVFMLGNKVKLIAPQSVVDGYAEKLEQNRKIYS